MAGKSRKPVPPKLQPWIDARRRHRLSHAQVQMARELGMNPRRLGKLGNHDQEPWKAPLPIFIEDLYRKRFGRDRPELVRSIEEIARLGEAKKRQRREEHAREAGAKQSPPNKMAADAREPSPRSGPRR